MPVWRDAAQAYDVVNVQLVGRMPYAGADRLLQAITDDRSGLTLHHFSLKSDGTETIEVDLVAGLIIPAIDGGPVAEHGVGATSGSSGNRASGGVRSTGGGRTIRGGGQ